MNPKWIMKSLNNAESAEAASTVQNQYVGG